MEEKETVKTFLEIREFVKMLNRFGVINIIFKGGSSINIAKEDYDNFLMSNYVWHSKRAIVELDQYIITMEEI